MTLPGTLPEALNWFFNLSPGDYANLRLGSITVLVFVVFLGVGIALVVKVGRR